MFSIHANYLWPLVLHLQQLATYTILGTLRFPQSVLGRERAERTAEKGPVALGGQCLGAHPPSAGVCWAEGGLLCSWPPLSETALPGTESRSSPAPHFLSCLAPGTASFVPPLLLCPHCHPCGNLLICVSHWKCPSSLAPPPLPA